MSQNDGAWRTKLDAVNAAPQGGPLRTFCLCETFARSPSEDIPHPYAVSP